MTDARQVDERRIVEAFAEHGAAKMARRRHHGRWVSRHWTDLDDAIAEEVSELSEALAHLAVDVSAADPECIRSVRAECIDVALTAMMLWDRLGQELE